MTTTTVPDDIRLVGERYQRFLTNGQAPSISIDSELLGAAAPGGHVIGCTHCRNDQRQAAFSVGAFVDAGEDAACAAQHETRRANRDYPACLGCNAWAQCETYLCVPCAEELAPGYADVCTAHGVALGQFRESNDQADLDAAAVAFGPLREHLGTLLRALGHDEQLVTTGIAQKEYFIASAVTTTTREVS